MLCIYLVYRWLSRSILYKTCYCHPHRIHDGLARFLVCPYPKTLPFDSIASRVFCGCLSHVRGSILECCSILKSQKQVISPHEIITILADFAVKFKPKSIVRFMQMRHERSEIADGCRCQLASNESWPTSYSYSHHHLGTSVDAGWSYWQSRSSPLCYVSSIVLDKRSFNRTKVVVNENEAAAIWLAERGWK